MAAVFSNGSFFLGEANQNHPPPLPNSGLALSGTARFWILLTFEIPSIVCCLFLLLCFLIDQILRQALNNHVIIALLISVLLSELLDISNYLTFSRLGYVWPQISITCYVWQFVYSCMFTMIGFLVAWMSIERHILIFHHHWTVTRNKRIFIHYVPLTTIVLYVIIFYTIIIFFPLCEHKIDYTVKFCNIPCAYSQKNILMFDTIVNNILPNISVTIFDIFLLIRVVKQKRRLHQNMQWQKYRRMILQLAACSSLFLLLNLPVMGLNLAHISGVPFFATDKVDFYTFFMSYFIILLMPFICLGSSPEIWNKIKRMMRKRHPVIVITSAPILRRPIISIKK